MGKATLFDPLTFAKVQAVDVEVKAIQAAVGVISKGIKSVQRGVTANVSGAQSVTISPVNTSRALVSLLTVRVTGGEGYCSARLKSATEIELIGIVSGGGSAISWEVVEYY